LRFIAGKYGQKAAIKMSGATGAYVGQALREDKERADRRPSNLKGPWTDPKVNPCSKCCYGLMDKNRKGCKDCSLPDQYADLLEDEGVRTRPDFAPARYTGQGINNGWVRGGY
jgi:hypothetical protein